MSTRRVHILSDGFRAPNARALLYPLIMHRRALAEAGISVRAFDRTDSKLAECDVLLVDSKHFHGPVRGQLAFVQDTLAELGSSGVALAWYDSTDSAGWLVGGVLPLVRRYFKSQLLRDRDAYLRPMYARRAYADFYHRHDGVSDDQPDDAPQVDDPALLARIRLGWNSGMADYSRFGPARMALYGRLPISCLLGRPRAARAANAPRRVPLSCRMGIAYARNSVAHQRRLIRDRLAQQIRSDKLGRGGYFDELKSSRAVLSPFGLGEITLKDFEVFLTGGLLVKPDMLHLETWPDVYRDGETMRAFRWDLDDLEDVLAQIEDDPLSASAIAARGQEEYLRLVSGPEAGHHFATRFADMVEDILRPDVQSQEKAAI